MELFVIRHRQGDYVVADKVTARILNTGGHVPDPEDATRFTGEELLRFVAQRTSQMRMNFVDYEAVSLKEAVSQKERE